MDALRVELHAVFPELSDALKAYLDSIGLAADTTEYFSRCFSENVRGGKLHRPLALLYVGKKLCPTAVSDADAKHLCVLGWLVEMLQAYALMVDDVMDGSTTRRGELCWYRRPESGLMAVNDACLLKSFIFYLLKKYFRTLPVYGTLVDMFLQTGLQTEIGQLCDTSAAKETDITKFTAERYFFTVKYKSSYYSIYLPIALALEYWGMATEGNLQQALDFAVAMGDYFQVQDDYIDVYGDPAVTGKIGTDIQDNKCSWLIVQALGRVSEEQRGALQAAYGRKEPHYVDKVKAIFGELKLEEAYAEYETVQRAKIEEMISQGDEREGLRHEVLLSLFQGFGRGR